MKKHIDLRIFMAALVMLVTGMCISTANASALTAEGESLIGGIVSAGSSLGIDIGGYITTTTQLQMNTGNAQADLSAFLKKIKFTYSETEIIELSDHLLNRGGTFEGWIYRNYGNSVPVPSSVKMMSGSQIVVFIMNNRFDADYTPETTTKYVFSDEEETTKKVLDDAADKGTTLRDESSSTVKPSQSQGQVQEIITTGDADNDGKITAADARLVLRVSARLEALPQKRFLSADVNRDGKISATDARSILRYSARLISEF